MFCRPSSRMPAPRPVLPGTSSFSAGFATITRVARTAEPLADSWSGVRCARLVSSTLHQSFLSLQSLVGLGHLLLEGLNAVSQQLRAPPRSQFGARFSRQDQGFGLGAGDGIPRVMGDG